MSLAEGGLTTLAATGISLSVCDDQIVREGIYTLSLGMNLVCLKLNTFMGLEFINKP